MRKTTYITTAAKAHMSKRGKRTGSSFDPATMEEGLYLAPISASGGDSCLISISSKSVAFVINSRSGTMVTSPSDSELKSIFAILGGEPKPVSPAKAGKWLIETIG